MQTEIRLSGFGGQGLITAGILLAEAAISEGNNAIHTQSYGPQARGGASNSEVIVSDGDIDYPRVVAPDVLLVMSQEAADKYAGTVRPGGVLICDSTFVEKLPDTPAVEVYPMPISLWARNDIGKGVVANIIAAGLVAGLTDAVGQEALLEAVRARFGKGASASGASKAPGAAKAVELNERALALGFAQARESRETAARQTAETAVARS